MEDFFIWMYQLTHGIQDDPLWDDVYVTAGLAMISLTIIVLFIYYHMLNRYFINFFKLKHWFIFMIIHSLIAAAVSYLIATSIVEPIEYTSEFISFAFINLLYATFFYSLFSLLICWGSPQAKYTPYKFYSKFNKD